LTRSRRITYNNLSQRDPMLVRSVDSAFAAPASTHPAAGSARLSPPPMFVPIFLRGLEITNRVAGTTLGAGLTISDFTAVSSEGRISPETPGIYSMDEIKRLKEYVVRAHGESRSRFVLQLGHAGRRGAARPPSQGVDRPLRWGGWPLLSASPVAYSKHGRVPEELTVGQMRRLVEAFAGAASAAAECAVDMLELNFAQGYLVASFISPLTNLRSDDYSGSLDNRMKFPLQILDRVREAWRGPLMVRISASDCAAGGTGLDEAVLIARALKTHGCDLLHPVMGQTVLESRPDYGRLFGVPASDRIRNEAGIATLASGHIATADEVNTVLAAGRADLCQLDDLPAGL
ncbi:MAG TPA: bifunctional salicylyl-CoA 5-hydroxylase/oxidoreductase, partial [Candidatus Dormibacteraeota bacterium]